MDTIDQCNSLYQQLLVQEADKRQELGNAVWLQQTLPIISGWTFDQDAPWAVESLKCHAGLSGKVLLKSPETHGLVLMLGKTPDELLTLLTQLTEQTP